MPLDFCISRASHGFLSKLKERLAHLIHGLQYDGGKSFTSVTSNAEMTLQGVPHNMGLSFGAWQDKGLMLGSWHIAKLSDFDLIVSLAV